MIARLLPIAALLILTATNTVLAADRLRLVSVPLDMPLSDSEARTVFNLGQGS